MGSFGFRKLISTVCRFRERARARAQKSMMQGWEKNPSILVNLCNGILFALIPHLKPCFVFMNERCHFLPSCTAADAAFWHLKCHSRARSLSVTTLYQHRFLCATVRFGNQSLRVAPVPKPCSSVTEMHYNTTAHHVIEDDTLPSQAPSCGQLSGPRQGIPHPSETSARPCMRHTCLLYGQSLWSV